jgi:urocanate hydratase
MMTPFQKEITQGLPEQLPIKRSVPGDVNRAPKRKDILTAKEKKLALENALRYFPVEWHEVLAHRIFRGIENVRSRLHVPIQAFL